MTEQNMKKLNAYAESIEKCITSYNVKTPDVKMQESIIDAMNYSLEAGGKRIRPILVNEFNHMCNGNYENAIAPACAVEMIHTFSLIHDDLPAMDNDDFRRGKPSCHKQFGEAEAILAGDALSVLAFGIIADDKDLPEGIKIKLISELAKSTGVYGMIGGQVIDMENEKRSNVDEANLRNMYAHKTGALIRASCKMGCISAGADKEYIEYADEYAKRLGLAFQIIDDILDVTSTPDVLGKPIGSDALQNKTTFVTLMGIENAKAEAEKLTFEALEILNKFDDNEFLVELTKYMLQREK